MAKPSLVQIPSGYKSGTLYSVVPNTAGGDLGFSRTGNAWRVGPDQNLQEMGYAVPRLDYSFGDCPVILMEDGSTNYIQQTKVDNNPTYWPKVIAGAGVDPIVTEDYGTFNGDASTRIQCDLGANSSGSVSSIHGASSVTTGVQWIYARSLTGSNANITLLGSANNSTIITPEWALYSTNVFGSTLRIGLYNIAGNDSICDIEVVMPQCENNSYPTSFIPTFGAAATRLVENTYTLLGTPINVANGGACIIKLKGQPFGNGGGDSTPILRLYIDSSNYLGVVLNGTNWRIRVMIGGATPDGIKTSPVSNTDDVALGITWTSAGYSLYANGQEFFNSTTDITAGLPSITQIGSNVANERGPLILDEMTVFDIPLSPEEIQKLTTL